eukprot:jgi/Chlat1/7250/Chrsp58S06893
MAPSAEAGVLHASGCNVRRDDNPMHKTEESHEPMETDEPPDHYHFAYIVFFCLGAGILFPWNAFITAVDYFELLYPHQHVDRVFPVSYMITNLLSIVLVFKYGNRFPPANRLLLGFSLFLVLLLVVPLTDALSRGGPGSSTGRTLVITAVSLTGTADAIAQGSIYGLAGNMPMRYTQAVMGGTSGAGLVVSLLRVLTKVLAPDTPEGLRAGAMLYFGMSAAMVAFCILCSIALASLPVMRHFHSLTELQVHCGPVRWQRLQDTAAEEEAHSLKESIVDSARYASAPTSHLGVLRNIWEYGTMVALIYMITLSIFPGFLAEDVSSQALGDWYSVLLILVFNAFDLVGKMMPCSQRLVIENRAVLWVMTLSRLLFVPAFLSCTRGPMWMRTETPILLLTGALGLTSGYTSSLCMMEGPKRVPPHDSEVAGTAMVLFLIVGLTIGAACGWLWLL